MRYKPSNIIYKLDMIPVAFAVISLLGHLQIELPFVIRFVIGVVFACIFYNRLQKETQIVIFLAGIVFSIPWSVFICTILPVQHLFKGNMILLFACGVIIFVLMCFLHGVHKAKSGIKREKISKESISNTYHEPKSKSYSNLMDVFEFDNPQTRNGYIFSPTANVYVYFHGSATGQLVGTATNYIVSNYTFSTFGVEVFDCKTRKSIACYEYDNYTLSAQIKDIEVLKERISEIIKDYGFTACYFCEEYQKAYDFWVQVRRELREEAQRERASKARQENSQSSNTRKDETIDRTLFAGCNDAESLKARYRQLMKTFHPDTQNGDSAMTQKIQKTYDVMKEEL